MGWMLSCMQMKVEAGTIDPPNIQLPLCLSIWCLVWKFCMLHLAQLYKLQVVQASTFNTPVTLLETFYWTFLFVHISVWTLTRKHRTEFFGCFLKSAKITIFILAVDHMTTWMWKRWLVTMNQQIIVTPLIFSFIATFNSLFWFSGPILLKTERTGQTDTVSHGLVSVVEHWAAKEPDISLMSEWRPTTEPEGEWILDSSGGQTHDSKWMLMLLHIW